MYMIYAKTSNMKRFKPLDVAQGILVDRKIYATMWTTLEDIKTDLAKLEAIDIETKFEIRKVG